MPFISENGAAINGLDLLNTNFPKELILSREKENLLSILKISSKNLQSKCKWLSDMNKIKQSLIFGLKDKKLNMALDRKYTIPFYLRELKMKKMNYRRL